MQYEFIKEPIARFIKLETSERIILSIVTVSAIVLVNSPISDVFLRFWSTGIPCFKDCSERGRKKRDALNQTSRFFSSNSFPRIPHPSFRKSHKSGQSSECYRLPDPKEYYRHPESLLKNC